MMLQLGLASRGWIGKVADRRAVAQEMVAHGLNECKGYGTFWNIYPLSIYSDLDLDVAAIGDSDIAFALKNLKYSDDEIKQRVTTALEKVDMLKYKDSSTFELSLGQKQRITIASSLALNPKILVLDEPTSMLDPISRKQIYDIVSKLHSEGTTIVYITHVLDEIF